MNGGWMNKKLDLLLFWVGALIINIFLWIVIAAIVEKTMDLFK